MKAMLNLDYYVWKFFVVKIRASWFRYKPLALLSLLYVSLFPLPRRFLKHFFRATGSPLQIDTRDLLLRNPRVLETLQRSLEHPEHNGDGKYSALKNVSDTNATAGAFTSRICIGQHLVSNPNHRYAIGSLQLLCTPGKDLLHISMEARYRFSGDNDRITRHLHRWLNSFREKGAAASFDIEGSTWTISRQALMSSEVFPRHRKYIDYNILYI